MSPQDNVKVPDAACYSSDEDKPIIIMFSDGTQTEPLTEQDALTIPGVDANSLSLWLKQSQFGEP